MTATVLLGWLPGGATAGAAPAAAGSASAVSGSTVAAVPSAEDAENQFISEINGLRASRGLAPLAIDQELTAQARSWAATMNGAGRIFHSQDLSAGISANWAKLGENVGVGADVPVLFQAFVDSPSHYENLVDPAYTFVGVGVVVSADGSRMYTAHRFMGVMSEAPAGRQAPPATAAPAPPPPPTTAAPTTTVPTVPTTAPQAAATRKFGDLDRVAALIGTD